MNPSAANFWKIATSLVVYYSFHRILYIGRRVFSLYIAVIFYATICCIDNIWFAFWALILGIQNGSSFSQTFVSGFLMHCLILASCYLQLFIRKHNQNQTTSYSWYTVPTILSTVSVLLIFFFGSYIIRKFPCVKQALALAKRWPTLWPVSCGRCTAPTN